MDEHKSILCFDPGDHTGWAYIDRNDIFSCGTIPKMSDNVNHLRLVAEKLQIFRPDIVVYETFALYPSMAKSLAWNSFFPCEVIGVIRYMAAHVGCEIVGQKPSVKKYAGPLPRKFHEYTDYYGVEITEHCKDATQHLCYYLRQQKDGSIRRLN